MDRTPWGVAEYVLREWGRREWVNELLRDNYDRKRDGSRKIAHRKRCPVLLETRKVLAETERGEILEPLTAHFRVTGTFEAPGRSVMERSFCGTHTEASDIFHRYGDGLMGCAVVDRLIERRINFNNGACRWVTA